MAQNSRPSRFEAVDPDTIDSDQSEKLVLEQSTRNHGAAHDLSADRRQAINRRDGVWRAFLYGNFRPRRRASRRTADDHHFWFDWHEPRILYLALGVLLLSCTDALFTLNLLEAGANEGNAVMASMLGESVDRFLAVKIGITGFSLIILVVAARRKLFRSFSVEHLLQVFCAGYVLLIGYEVYLAVYVFELSISSGP